MSKPSDSSLEIQSELKAEVQAELARRSTLNLDKKKIEERRERKDGEGKDVDAITPLIAAAVLACLALLAGTGIGLSLGYAPAPDDAAASLDWMQRSTFGTWLRGIHWHAANLMVALSGAYLFWLLTRGLYRRPAQWRFWRAALLLALVVGFSLTGQLLPWDQNAVHGNAIRLGYLAEAPIIGDWLRGALTGGGEAGTLALSRYFAMHVIVLPACVLLFVRCLWADARGAFTTTVGVAGVIAAICVLAAMVFPAPLGLQGDLGEQYPNARPEWFALPLYTLLKFVPSGILHLLTLFAPPLLGGLMIAALPFIDAAADKPAKLLKPLRISLLIGAVGFGALAFIPLAEDHSNNAGWFGKADLEDLMGAMGKRNLRLGHGTQALPDTAHVNARDIRVLSKRMAGLYPAEIKDDQKAQWDEWAAKMAELSDGIILATEDGARRKLRADLRKACADCHKLHADDEIELEPRLAQVVGQAAHVPTAGAFFDASKLAGLKPNEIPETSRTTKRLMTLSKNRLRDMLRHAGMAPLPENTPAPVPEQSYLDLRQAVALFKGQWSINEGTHAERAAWEKDMVTLEAALEALRGATAGADAQAKLDAVGKACDGCHKAGDWSGEPFDWEYAALKR